MILISVCISLCVYACLCQNYLMHLSIDRLKGHRGRRALGRFGQDGGGTVVVDGHEFAYQNLLTFENTD